MMRFSQNPRSLIVTTIVASAAVAYVLFVFLPGQRAVGQLREKLHLKQQEVVQAERLTFAIEQTRQDLQYAREFTQKFQADSPSETAVAELFASISSLAEQAEVRLTKLEPQATVHLDSVWHLSVAVHCHGRFHQIFDFAHRLESLPVTIWLTDVDLKLAGRSVPGGAYQDPSLQSGENLSAKVSLLVFADKRENSD